MDEDELDEEIEEVEEVEKVEDTPVKPEPEDPDSSEDWDFPDDLYESDSDVDEQDKDFAITDVRPSQFSSYKSKFNYGEAKMELFAELDKNISFTFIEMGANPQSLPLVRKHFNVLIETWDKTAIIMGHMDVAKGERYINVITQMLNKYKNSTLPDDFFMLLRNFKKLIYRSQQYLHMGLQVEKIRRGAYDKARRKIQQ